MEKYDVALFNIHLEPVEKFYFALSFKIITI